MYLESHELWGRAWTYIRSTDTSDTDTDEHIAGVLERRDRAVLNSHVLDGVQDERGVLWGREVLC